MRVLRYEGNRGVAQARNTLLIEAEGSFIAWLDSDDVAHQTRAEVQIGYLERNPNIEVCNGWTTEISIPAKRLGSQRDKRVTRRLARSSTVIKWFQIFSNQVATSGVMERIRSRRERDVLFDTCLEVSEDYSRWNYFALQGSIGGVASSVSTRYVSANSLSFVKAADIARNSTNIQMSYLNQLGMNVGEWEAALHHQLTDPTSGVQSRPDRDVFAYGVELCERLGVAFPESASTIRQSFLIYWIRYVARRGGLTQRRLLFSGWLIKDLLPATLLYAREKGPLALLWN